MPVVQLIRATRAVADVQQLKEMQNGKIRLVHNTDARSQNHQFVRLIDATDMIVVGVNWLAGTATASQVAVPEPANQRICLALVAVMWIRRVSVERRRLTQTL